MTGQEWKPSNTPAAAAPAQASTQATASASVSVAATSPRSELDSKITKQGELVRDLKAKKASKEEVTKEVGVLLALKAEFKTLTGEPDAALAPAVVTSSAASKAEKAPKPEKPKQEPKPKKQPDEKKQTRLGLEAKKEENLPDWYSQVINFFDFSAVFDHLNY